MSASVIESHRITRYQFPRSRPIGDSRVGPADTHFIGSLELWSSSGHVGLGFFGSLLFPLPPLAELERVFAAEVAPWLLGQNPFALTNRAIRHREHNIGSNVFVQAIDHALWDLQGKELGLPLYRLLGGTNSRVVAYASGLDFHLDMEDFYTFYAMAAERGYSAFKIKVGHPDGAWELERLKILVDIVGPDATLMIDANEAWTPKEAVLRAYAYREAGYNIYWIEDPCLRDDFEGLAYVAQKTPFVHINVGEYVDLQGKRKLLEHRAADILNVWGSFTDMSTAGWLAAGYGIPVSLSNMYLEMGVSMATALPGVTFMENSIQAYGLLVEEPVAFEDGYAIAPERPGHGLVLSEAARAEYAQPTID